MATERVCVSVFDPATGDTETAELLPDSYVLTLGERMEIAHFQQYANGTVQMTLKRPREERPMADLLPYLVEVEERVVTTAFVYARSRREARRRAPDSGSSVASRSAGVRVGRARLAPEPRREGGSE